MGWFSDFFGGGKSEQQSSSFLPEQSEQLKRALSVYGEQLGKNPNVYPGQRVADLTGLQTGALGAAPNFLGAFGTPQTVGQPLSAETGKAITGLLNQEYGAEMITPEQTERYFQESVYDPTVRSLKTDVLPTIGESYAGGNFFGSGKSKAVEKAVTDTSRDLTRARSDLNWNVLQNNQGIAEAKAARALSTVPQAIQYGNQPAENTLNNLRIAAAQVEGLGSLFGLGQAEQTQEQREIEASIAKFAEEHQITDPTNLAILLSLIGQTMSTSSSTQTAPGLGNTLASSFLKTAGGNIAGKLFPV